MARKLDKLGMRCSDTAEIYFDDVRVPADHIIGREGQGFMYQMRQVCSTLLLMSIAYYSILDIIAKIENHRFHCKIGFLFLR